MIPDDMSDSVRERPCPGIVSSELHSVSVVPSYAIRFDEANVKFS